MSARELDYVDFCYVPQHQEALEAAGYSVTVVPNQGKGAALARINAARRMFPSVWMNEDTTEPGRDALTYYHEKWDEERDIGLGPAHDWASHGADAYGLMAVVAEDYMRSTGIKRDVPRRRGSPMAR